MAVAAVLTMLHPCYTVLGRCFMSARPGFHSNYRREPGDSEALRVDPLRVPPHSVEAEQAVLGG